MKKKLSNRDLNLLLALLGVVIFLLVYFLGFTRLQAANEALDSDIRRQETRLAELQGYYDNLDTYEQGITDSKVSIDANLQRLPGDVKDEDFLLYLMDMHANAGSDLTGVSFDSVSLVSQFNCMIEGESKSLSGYRSVSTSTASMDYSQLKACISRLYDTQDITFLDSVSVTYDSESTLLDTVFTVSKLYADYDGAVYTPAEAPELPQGTMDLFGTGSAATVEVPAGE